MNRVAVGLLLLGALGGALPTHAASTCYGRPGDGRLDNGVPLPLSGENFVAYSHLSRMFDRNFVHDRVANVMLAAYATLAKHHPSLVFVYGETGHEAGGPMPPHRTHQNGLLVDFMVPLRDADGTSAPLPTWPWNRYGYDLEFDAEGTLDDTRIDFAAIAAHLRALHEAARAQGIGIRQVIFDPPYLAKLHATPDGDYLRRHLQFLPRPAWVRHDEHYHVDFAVRCAAG
ncbi:penicillin-insensitive murein endopeptidase [Chiayiivirga flava]|uniref:Penicillin-insensitive murein endopeptidase n=1 Tax=Chiayiivirga flava TaxID=659595 RepID=A0A7W8D4E8_9GAMM|nr:penicillin-insensitive murein endopeptidase [Chiayiivirga flava]MBB5207724.1 penicillin-insensitive murein endopeptidase [Chiayiivirga flava]